MNASQAPGGFALYVHWPYCLKKCPYCDFNSHVPSLAIDHRAWQSALLSELDEVGQKTTGRKLDSIFFGGGTPSLMVPATVNALVERARQWWVLHDDCEITLEANPTSTEAKKLHEFRHAGINRISLGVQSLNDESLRFLGREHSAAEAIEAVRAAASAVERWSFDLIYGRPGQTVAEWEAELDQALNHVGGHISAYQLTLEPGTKFHAMAERGSLTLPDEDDLSDFFRTTRRVLNSAGLPAYEVSNHARTGEECRHNLVYWRYGDYAGIGPGAHGRLTHGNTRWATQKIRDPRRWLDAVDAHSEGHESTLLLSRGDQMIEMVLMGLRLCEGLDLSRLAALADVSSEALIMRADEYRLLSDGWLHNANGRLCATEHGIERLDAVTSRLIESWRPCLDAEAA